LVVDCLSKSVNAKFANTDERELESVIVISLHFQTDFSYSLKILVIFSFFSSVRFSLSKRHFFIIHSNHHVIQISLHTKSIILHQNHLFSIGLLISSNKSIPTNLVTEFSAFAQFNKPLAALCSHADAPKKFSGLFSIFVINAVVFGLLTTCIFQI
jgi:hypothetical protein